MILLASRKREPTTMGFHGKTKHYLNMEVLQALKMQPPMEMRLLLGRNLRQNMMERREWKTQQERRKHGSNLARLLVSMRRHLDMLG
jgi:hypothetical protein